MANQTPLDLPAPEDRIARIHTLAYDLAYGVVRRLWSNDFHINRHKILTVWETPEQIRLNRYFLKKWWSSIERSPDDYFGLSDIGTASENLDTPPADLLVAFRYLEEKPSDKTYNYRLTEKAFALLEKAPPAAIFISYNRKQSSAFALLVLNVLQREGINAFLDIRSIAPGDDWDNLIQEEIEKRENFICLLAPDSLQSPYVRREIKWAAEDKGKKRIIPIFHNNFRPDDFKDDEFQDLLTYNAIVVIEETAIAYESAILQLLNYFGRTL